MNRKNKNIISAGITLSILYIELHIVYGLVIGLIGYRLRTILIGIAAILTIGRSLRNLIRIVERCG